MSAGRGLRPGAASAHEPITEIHIVGGCHPDLPFTYYLDMLRGSRPSGPRCTSRPSPRWRWPIWPKAGLSVPDTLMALKEAGLGSLPGGGAEVFSPRMRRSLCPEKLSPEGWLEVAKMAHGLGTSTPTPPCSTATWRAPRSGWIISSG
jgi:aminodeoxyfutalosine synthase